jgi:hypothetical protein
LAAAVNGGSGSLDHAAAAMDRLRRSLLRVGLSTELGARLFWDRALRLGILSCLAVAAAFGLACFAPLWLLVLGPALYGVPHIGASLSRAFPHRPGRESV